MTSNTAPQDTPLAEPGKRQSPASVWFKDQRYEKLIRRAAVEVDESRSEFMVQAGIARARAVLRLNRDEDFQSALAALDNAA